MQQVQCKLTGELFSIREKDIQFYEKISPVFNDKVWKVPPPTLHPRERERRRLAVRNERHLYKRKSSLSGTEIISNIHQSSPHKVYSHKEWWNDDWDASDYAWSYDFNLTFFKNFHQLQLRVPRPPLINNKSENSDYCNYSDGNKNCYLVTTANWNRDSYYGFLLVNNNNAVDALWCSGCQLVYQCVDCINCYNLKYSRSCEQCVDGAYLYDCRGVQNCLFCTNLRNKKFQILNRAVSKEEYQKVLDEISGNQESLQEYIDKYTLLLKEKTIYKISNKVESEDVLGNNIFNSKNIFHGFDIFDCRDCAYLHDGLKAKDCFDVEYFDGTELCYESTSLIGYGYRFTMFCRDSYNLFYCDNCHACKNCFGCCGLRNKEYCIFNKQFSQNEYERFVPEIIKHMQNTGEWGEFFPISISPFAYNETLAQDDMPLSRDEVLKRRYKWRDFEPVERLTTRTSKDISGIITCEKCAKEFRLIKQELEFYKQMNIVVPKNCPDCRHRERLQQRTSRKLYNYNCKKCGSEQKSAFSPNRPETIYCEKCYLETVY